MQQSLQIYILPHSANLCDFNNHCFQSTKQYPPVFSLPDLFYFIASFLVYVFINIVTYVIASAAYLLGPREAPRGRDWYDRFVGLTSQSSR